MKKSDINLDFRPDTYWPSPLKRKRRSKREILSEPFGKSGGSWLPEGDPGDVEVARIFLHSVLGDVIAVRANCSDGVIRYWAVDEYDHDLQFWPEVSELPLTLQELINGLDGICLDSGHDRYYASPEAWYAEGGSGFVEVSSDFYPDLGMWYELEWQEREEQQGEREEEQEEEDLDEGGDEDDDEDQGEDRDCKTKRRADFDPRQLRLFPE